MPTTPAVRAAAARRRTPWRWAWAAGVMATAALLLVVLRPGSKHTIPAPPLGTTPSPPVAVTPPSLATLAHLEPLPVRLTRGAAEPGSFEEARVMGLEAYQSGRYDSAAVRFQRALSHRPEDAEMRLYLASTDLMQRRSAAAIPRLQQLANDSSGAIQGEALWLLANAQLLEERAADAITTLERLDAMEGRHRLEAETLLRTVREKSAPK